MKAFAPTNKSLGHLSFLIPSRFSLCFIFWMFPTRVSHSRASCCAVSKWRFLVCQSIHGLCITQQDNPMMTRFFKDEMTLKTTLLVWEPMVIFNGLVSCVINRNERFQPSMTLTDTGVLFSTITNFYCCTTSLSIKNANALKSISVWVSIVTNLLHLIMIGIKKHGVRSKDRLGPFSLHYASRFSLMVLTQIGHACFSLGCGLVIEMVCVACGPCFFGHSQTTWSCFPQYKQRLFIHQHCFSYSVRGLNLILSICMGSSFGKVTKGLANIVVWKFICVFYVGSWHFFH